MNLAEIRKKANRDRDDAAVRPCDSRYESVAVPESGDEDFAKQGETFYDNGAAEELDWYLEGELVLGKDSVETSWEYPVEEDLNAVESPVAPRLFSAPALPASAAMEGKVSFPARSEPDSTMRAETETVVDQVPEEGHDNIFDPLSILMAGRAAAGYGNDMTSDSDEHPVAETVDYQEFLCFRVSNEQYAINIMEIKEIIKPREITEVPRVPDFISGVLSLRGIIIPVFNMRKRLHLESGGVGGRERIVVVGKGEELFGIHVDEVLQVVRIQEGGIEQPPAVLEGIDRDFVQGIGRHPRGMLILLNLANILDVSLI